MAFDARQNQVINYGNLSGPLDQNGQSIGVVHSLRAEGFDASEDGTGRGVPLVPYTIHGTDKTQRIATETDIAGSLRTKPPGSQENSSSTVIAQLNAVRRLTPLECERLQGFEDHYTRIEGAADGPRYRAIGNSMAVTCMRWLGRRIVTSLSPATTAGGEL